MCEWENLKFLKIKRDIKDGIYVIVIGIFFNIRNLGLFGVF